MDYRNFSKQDTFENDIIAQLKSNNIISELDKDIFMNLKTLRHKSAHPSGHKPTAEEARYVYREVILRVLSKESLGSKNFIDDLINNRLNDNNFFPSSNTEIKLEIVQEELTHIHENYYNLLIVELSKNLEEKLNKSEELASLNTAIFLNRLSVLEKKELNENLFNYFIKKYCTKTDIKIIGTLVSCINLKNELLLLIKEDKSTLTRLNELLLILLDKQSSQINIFFNQNAKIIVENNLYATFEEPIKKYLENNLYDFPKEFLEFEQHRIEIVQKFIDNASCGNFDTENKFIQNYKKIDDFMKISEEEAFKVCEAIKTSASGQYFAYDAKEVLDNNFNDIPKTKELAKKYLISNPDIEIDEILKIAINKENNEI